MRGYTVGREGIVGDVTDDTVYEQQQALRDIAEFLAYNGRDMYYQALAQRPSEVRQRLLVRQADWALAHTVEEPPHA